jgi:hypothetical protein
VVLGVDHSISFHYLALAGRLGRLSVLENFSLLLGQKGRVRSIIGCSVRAISTLLGKKNATSKYPDLSVFYY